MLRPICAKKNQRGQWPDTLLSTSMATTGTNELRLAGVRGEGTIGSPQGTGPSPALSDHAASLPCDDTPSLPYTIPNTLPEWVFKLIGPQAEGAEHSRLLIEAQKNTLGVRVSVSRQRPFCAAPCGPWDAVTLTTAYNAHKLRTCAVNAQDIYAARKYRQINLQFQDVTRYRPEAVRYLLRTYSEDLKYFPKDPVGYNICCQRRPSVQSLADVAHPGNTPMQHTMTCRLHTRFLSWSRLPLALCLLPCGGNPTNCMPRDV